MQDKPKRLTGWQRRQIRAQQGLPLYTPAEAKSRQERSARKAAERARVNSEFITQLKLKLGCADCGYREHPAALDFDHLPGADKRRGISRMLTVTRETLMAEIAKCEVVCSNCHRIRTWTRTHAPA